MTRIGNWRPMSSMTSNSSRPTSLSSTLIVSLRTSGSRPFMRRGVKMRCTICRYIVCRGGSSKMKVPAGISIFCLIISRMPPRPEISALWFMKPARTSS